MTTATRVGELGAPVRCPPLGTTYFYKEPRNSGAFCCLKETPPHVSVSWAPRSIHQSQPTEL